jgi:hypothetical protein
MPWDVLLTITETELGCLWVVMGLLAIGITNAMIFQLHHSELMTL